MTSHMVYDIGNGFTLTQYRWLWLFLVEMLVNHACNQGPYLDPVKVAGLPNVFRGRIRDVLQNGIQAIVNAAYKPKTVLGFLQPGKGKVRKFCVLGILSQRF